MQTQVRKWFEETTGIPKEEMQTELRDGTLLCQLLSQITQSKYHPTPSQNQFQLARSLMRKMGLVLLEKDVQLIQAGDQLGSFRVLEQIYRKICAKEGKRLLSQSSRLDRSIQRFKKTGHKIRTDQIRKADLGRKKEEWVRQRLREQERKQNEERRQWKKEMEEKQNKRHHEIRSMLNSKLRDIHKEKIKVRKTGEANKERIFRELENFEQRRKKGEIRRRRNPNKEFGSDAERRKHSEKVFRSMKVRYRNLDNDRKAFIKRKNHQIKLEHIENQNFEDPLSGSISPPEQKSISTHPNHLSDSDATGNLEDPELPSNQVSTTLQHSKSQQSHTQRSQTDKHISQTLKSESGVSPSQPPKPDILIEKSIHSTEKSVQPIEKNIDSLLQEDETDLTEGKAAQRQKWRGERKERMMVLRKEILNKRLKKREWRIEIMENVVSRLLEATEIVVSRQIAAREQQESESFRNRERLQTLERKGAQMVENYLKGLTNTNKPNPGFQVITERTDECDDEDFITAETQRIEGCSQILNKTLNKKVTGMVPKKKKFLEIDLRSETQRRRRKFSELPKLTDILETLTRMSFNHHTRTNSFRQNSNF